ncbi:MAG: response regulator, partial [Desulfobacterales bacterium]
LTREVRKKFTKTQLPILMITTQSDFTVDDMVNVQQTEKNFSQSGINRILYKPFTDEQLKEAVTDFLKHT